MVASTPSDRRAPQNALSTLRRTLRRIDDVPALVTPAPLVEPAIAIQASPPVEPMSVIEPTQLAMSDQEWEAWKRQYWRDEKLRAKNEKLLSVVSTYLDGASEIFRKHDGIGLGLVTDTVKETLRKSQYKSKVVLYNCKCFEQGIVVLDVPDVPVL